MTRKSKSRNDSVESRKSTQKGGTSQKVKLNIQETPERKEENRLSHDTASLRETDSPNSPNRVLGAKKNFLG